MTCVRLSKMVVTGDFCLNCVRILIDGTSSNVFCSGWFWSLFKAVQAQHQKVLYAQERICDEG